MPMLPKESLLMNIIQMLPDIVYLKDIKGCYQEVNREFEKFAGKPREDIIGKTDYELFSLKEAEQIVGIDKKAMASLAPLEYEITVKNSKGDLVHFYSKKAPFYDAQTGEVVGVIGISRNITDFKKLHLKLSESEAVFSNTIYSMSDGWALHKMIWDENGQALDYIFLDINPEFEKIIGKSKDEVIGRSVLELFPETETHWIQSFSSVVRSGKSIHFEQYSKTFDETFRVFAMPIGLDQFSVIVSNITAQKRMEAYLLGAKKEAEALSRSKNRFLSNMSHEMRTPIHGILGLSQMIQNTKNLKEIYAYSKRIQESSEKVMRLIEDVIDYSDSISRQALKNNQATNIFDLIGEIKEVYGFLAHSKSLGFECSIKSRMPEWMIIDGIKLKKIIEHLLSNAIKYTIRGEVKIHFQFENGLLVVEVVDTGVGMDEWSQRRAFEPFFQADDSKSKHFQGMGLGLALVREFTIALNGVAEVKSALGEGTSIKVQMPVKSLDLGGSLALKETEKNVLILDDDMVSRLMIEKVLKNHDLKVHLAECLEDAELWLDRRPMKMIIMNLNIHTMEGESFIAFMEKQIQGKSPVLGIVDDKYKISEINYLFDFIIEKPIHLDQIRSFVEKQMFKF